MAFWGNMETASSFFLAALCKCRGYVVVRIGDRTRRAASTQVLSGGRHSGETIRRPGTWISPARMPRPYVPSYAGFQFVERAPFRLVLREQRAMNGLFSSDAAFFHRADRAHRAMCLYLRRAFALVASSCFRGQFYFSTELCSACATMTAVSSVSSPTRQAARSVPLASGPPARD